MSLLLEGYSLLVAIRTVTAGAASQGLSFTEFVRRGMDPTSIAVMMEDGAACAGLIIAGQLCTIMPRACWHTSWALVWWGSCVACCRVHLAAHHGQQNSGPVSCPYIFCWHGAVWCLCVMTGLGANMLVHLAYMPAVSQALASLCSALNCT